MKLLCTSTHYSKSQIFVQKFNFDITPTFSRVSDIFWKFGKFKNWSKWCRIDLLLLNNNSLSLKILLHREFCSYEDFLVSFYEVTLYDIAEGGWFYPEYYLSVRSQNTLIRASIRLFFRSYTNIYSSNELNEYLWLTQCILYESPLFFSECECISRERVGSSIDYRYWFLLHHKIVPFEVGIDRQCTYFFSKCKNSILIPNVRWLLLFRIHLVQ